jgi:hypothetical protein
MAALKPLVQWKTSLGKPIVIRDSTIIPQAKALVIKLPFFGFVWNRPVAILVERDGQQQRFPIFDVTRTAVLVLTGVTLTISLGSLLTKLLHKGTGKS